MTCIFNSENLKGSDWIVDSKNIENSFHVFNSTDVLNSKNIHHSLSVTNSQNIYESSIISDSSRVLLSDNITDSSNIVLSTTICGGDSIFNSVNCFNSSALTNCKGCTDCYFCADCDKLEKSMFCQGVTGRYMIFNEPVEEMRFELFKKQFKTYFTELNLCENWYEGENLKLLNPSPRYDRRKHYMDFNLNFWIWASMLPNYNQDIIYKITFR